MKHNTVTREGIYWTATILHQCGHEREWLRLRSSNNNGEGCTIGEARHIVRAEAGMLCPDCRVIKRSGRPRIAAETMTTHPVTLTREALTTAKRLGDGNVSAGVRSALAIVCDAHAALAMAEYDLQDTAQLHAAVIAAEHALRVSK